MAYETKLITGAQFIFRDSTDYNPVADNKFEIGTPTYVQIDLTSVANGAGRESAKVNLGTQRAEAYAVKAALEFAATPTANARVDFYWAPSDIAVAANANPHSMAGVDGAAPSGYGTLAELLANLDFIGSMITTDDATGTVQIADVGTLYPTSQYGMLVVVNNSGAAMHSDAVEMSVSFVEILPQYQTS